MVDINRAKSWLDIFENPQEADTQYEALIAEFRRTYTPDDTKNVVTEKREIDPLTGIDTQTFDLGKGYFTKIRRMPVGDVEVTFTYPDRTNSAIITAPIGNIRHDFSFSEIKMLQAKINKRSEEIIERDSDLLFHLKGKLATEYWEGSQLRANTIPQRVGFKIYRGKALEEARLLVSGTE